MGADQTALIDVAKMEKMLLAKQVGHFLSKDQADDQRATVEQVARKLADDVCVQVRRVLAFELRKCKVLVPDLSEKIALDVEAVAGPFLEATQAITDKAFVRLLPQLEDYALAILAGRSDLSPKVVHALTQMGGEASISRLVRNDDLHMPEPACVTLVNRFGDNMWMMDQFSARRDLPITIVERIVDKVSEHCREVMVSHYAVKAEKADKLLDSTKLEFLVEQLEGADEAQVHACVTELRAARRLNHLMAVEIASRGCLPFLESALALEAGLPRGRVKEILTLIDQAAFVKLMQMANVSKNLAPRILQLAKKNYQGAPLAA